MAFKHILIAIDGSEYSLAAASRGIKLANRLKARCALVFVVDTSKALGNVDAGITHNEAMIVLKKEAEQTLEQTAAAFKGDLVKLMPEGHPREEILKTAEIWGADLIVVGTHGRTGLLRLLMGSTSEWIIRHSKIPVMTVPAK